MGASAWSYFVPYQSDIRAALEALRKEEFLAWQQEHPNKRFKTIDALLKWKGADGASSILDVNRISTNPLAASKHDFSKYNFHNPDDMKRFMAVMQDSVGSVYPLSDEDYIALFGTQKPTRQDIERAPQALDMLYNRIERGSGVYLVLYKNNQPSEIYFMGITGD
jgi:hypothetical protein